MRWKPEQNLQMQIFHESPSNRIILFALIDLLQNAVDIIAIANVIELETITPKSHFCTSATFVFLVKDIRHVALSASKECDETPSS